MGIRARVLWTAVAGVAAAAAMVVPGSAWAGAGTGGTWGQAEGFPALSGNGISSMACAPGGYCATAVGGDVLTARNGVWGKPVPVDTSALGSKVTVNMGLVACPATGDCVAVGTYSPTPARQVEPVVVSEHNGVWGKAEPAGSLTDNSIDGAATSPNALDCSSAGNCALSAQEGDLTTGELLGSYAIIEKNGVWGTQDDRVGVKALSCTNHSCLGLGAGLYISGKWFSNYVQVESGRGWKTLWMHGVGRLAPEYFASCALDGSCTTIGRVHGSSLTSVTERNGVWGRVHVIPGTETTSNSGYNPTGESCTAAGSCAVGGFIQSPGHAVPFAATERNGVWGKPQIFPGIAKLNLGGSGGEVDVISCTGPGNCAAGGDVSSGPFLVSDVNGIWGKAVLVPGISKLANTGGGGSLEALSCWAPQRCVAGGGYDRKPAFIAIPYVVSEH